MKTEPPVTQIERQLFSIAFQTDHRAHLRCLSPRLLNLPQQRRDEEFGHGACDGGCRLLTT